MVEPWEVDCVMHSHGYLLGFKAAMAIVEKRFLSDLKEYRIASLQKMSTKDELAARVRVVDGILWDLTIECDKLERMMKDNA